MNAAVAPAAVVVRRTIAASPEELFDAWLDPEALAIWMRPGAIRSTQAKVDARVGGHYEIVMQSESATYTTVGAYCVIDRPRHLAFTWGPGGTAGFDSLVTVDFLPQGGCTEVVLTHEKLPEDMREPHRNGWTSGIERLEQYLSGGKRQD
jgi:uncharacterized protein YndB with AHSA1/START domain